MARIHQRLIIGGLFIGVGLAAGCSEDKPQSYSEQRPSVSSLSPDDSGLQSKDVLAASDQLASDLLTTPQLAQSRTQWTIVVTGVEDNTIDKSFAVNYDIFTERLKTILSEKGQGRIALIANKSTYHAIRDRELEGSGDQFGQGPGGGQPAPEAINPDFALKGTASDMPNRSTNYYLLTFDLTNLRTRVIVWSRHYEVKVSR